MGVVPDYEQIRQKSVAVVGCGGVGSVAAEMLSRCGIGRLVLFDYDTVELANMNRLFFRPEHRGMSKVAAAARMLKEINPDVDIVERHVNVAKADQFDEFTADLRTQQVGTSGPIDLLLCCVDNFAARMVVNQACLETAIPWMESGVAENAMSGHIQLLVPGFTPCYGCLPPLVVATSTPEAKRDGVCAASLPTTMGIIAGLLAHNALKFLLGFGQVSEYVGYDSLRDHFPSVQLKPNPECTNSSCRERQASYASRPLQDRRRNPLDASASLDTGAPAQAAAPRSIDADAWGIVVEPSAHSAPEPEANHDGFEAAHHAPAPNGPDTPASATTTGVMETPLADLMAQLRSASQPS